MVPRLRSRVPVSTVSVLVDRELRSTIYTKHTHKARYFALFYYAGRAGPSWVSAFHAAATPDFALTGVRPYRRLSDESWPFWRILSSNLSGSIRGGVRCDWNGFSGKRQWLRLLDERTPLRAGVQ